MTTELLQLNSMKIEFYDNDAPNTQKLCDLAKKGFYDGLNFYRVIPVDL